MQWKYYSAHVYETLHESSDNNFKTMDDSLSTQNTICRKADFIMHKKCSIFIYQFLFILREFFSTLMVTWMWIDISAALICGIFCLSACLFQLFLCWLLPFLANFLTQRIFVSKKCGWTFTFFSLVSLVQDW